MAPAGRRFLQEQRMACEVGLYYVLHITKQRNKNALLRLLPGLGESGVPASPLPSVPLPASTGSLGSPSSLSAWRLFGAEVRGAQLCLSISALPSSHHLLKHPFLSGRRATLILP